MQAVCFPGPPPGVVRSAQRGPFLPPSDLQVPSSTRLWGAPQRHPWFPTPAWRPCLDPFPAQELPGAPGPSRPGRASSPDPRSPCPVTLPAWPLSAGLRVTGSPPLALGTRAFTCLELEQHAVRVEGCTPPPQSRPPGPPWNGISSDHRVRDHLPQQPCPFGLQQTGGRPSPRPLPSALWLCSGCCREHWPCPQPREPSRLSSSSHGRQPLQGPLSLRHSWTHPVPATLSPHAVLVRSAHFITYS